MEVIVKEEARQDLAEMNEDIRDRILEEIEGLEKNATPSNSTFIEIGKMELFRLNYRRKTETLDLIIEYSIRLEMTRSTSEESFIDREDTERKWQRSWRKGFELKSKQMQLEASGFEPIYL